MHNYFTRNARLAHPGTKILFGVIVAGIATLVTMLFILPAVTAAQTSDADITSPTDGEEVSDVLSLEANVSGDLDLNEDQPINFAVKTETCEANEDPEDGGITVFGNVDGQSNDFTFDGESGEFSSDFDTTTQADGDYCFIFNPNEEGDEADARATADFTIANDVQVCENPDPEADLTGEITSEGEATITNHSEVCEYEVGFASYMKFNEDIDDQELFEFATTTIEADTTENFSIDTPQCAYQSDLFYGELLEDLDGQRYGERKLDFNHNPSRDVVEPGDYCVEDEPADEPLHPILECVVEEDEDDFIAHFGFENENGEEVTVNIGDDNKFTGGGTSDFDQGQPEDFRYPTDGPRDGRTPFYPDSEFTVDFDGTNLVWTLTGPDGETRTATASSESDRCEPQEEPEDISPVLECVEKNGDEDFTARFGYDNPNNSTTTVDIGDDNKFNRDTQDQGQPEDFAPGRVVNDFQVDFDGSELVWTLQDSTATASDNPAQRCEEPEPEPDRPLECSAEASVSVDQGFAKSPSGEVKPVRSDVIEALGLDDPEDRGEAEGDPNQFDDPDEVDYYSLGFGGELTLRFEESIENGPGDDIRIFETSYPLDPDDPSEEEYPEMAEVYASESGTSTDDFVLLGTVTLDGTVDLGPLDSARYVRIVDVSDPSDFADTEHSDGYDVAGISAFNCVPDEEPVEDVTLTIIKDVINDDDGTATSSDFTIEVREEGSATTTVDFVGSATGTEITLTAGVTYQISESGPIADYEDPVFSGECDGINTVNLSGDEVDATCTITNDDIEEDIAPFCEAGDILHLSAGPDERQNDGNLYRVDPATGSSTLIESYGQDEFHSSLATDGAGNIFAISADDNDLVTLETDGTINTVASTSGLSRPVALTFAGEGTLYALDQDNDALYEIDASTGSTTQLEVFSNEDLDISGGDVVVDEDGDLIYVRSEGAVYHIDIDDFTVTLEGELSQTAHISSLVRVEGTYYALDRTTDSASISDDDYYTFTVNPFISTQHEDSGPFFFGDAALCETDIEDDDGDQNGEPDTMQAAGGSPIGLIGGADDDDDDDDDGITAGARVDLSSGDDDVDMDDEADLNDLLAQARQEALGLADRFGVGGGEAVTDGSVAGATFPGVPSTGEGGGINWEFITLLFGALALSGSAMYGYSRFSKTADLNHKS